MWPFSKSEKQVESELREALVAELDQKIEAVTEDAEPSKTVEQKIENYRQAMHRDLVAWESRLIDFDAPQECQFCGCTAFKRTQRSTYRSIEINDYRRHYDHWVGNVYAPSLFYFETHCTGCGAAGRDEKTKLGVKVDLADVTARIFDT
jgi:hypothetical protein